MKSTWDESELHPIVVRPGDGADTPVTAAITYWEAYGRPIVFKAGYAPVPASAHAANGGAR